MGTGKLETRPAAESILSPDKILRPLPPGAGGQDTARQATAAGPEQCVAIPLGCKNHSHTLGSNRGL